jgi:hypothetical protein
MGRMGLASVNSLIGPIGPIAYAPPLTQGPPTTHTFLGERAGQGATPVRASGRQMSVSYVCGPLRERRVDGEICLGAANAVGKITPPLYPVSETSVSGRGTLERVSGRVVLRRQRKRRTFAIARVGQRGPRPNKNARPLFFGPRLLAPGDDPSCGR